MTCSFTAIAAPMTPYHGVEHLDINCTTSVSKMLIQITVERTVGATFASQYNTFWSSTTNESYLQNSTHIIYTWTILAGQIVSGSGFPYFVEGQYSLPNINQTTSHDTYSAQLTSVCGNTVTSSGKFWSVNHFSSFWVFLLFSNALNVYWVRNNFIYNSFIKKKVVCIEAIHCILD